MEDSTLQQLLDTLNKQDDRIELRLGVIEKKVDKLIERTAALWERSGLMGLIGGAIPAGVVLAIVLIRS